MSKIDELRKVRHQHRTVAYTIGDLNEKLKMEPKRADIKAMRAKFLEELRQLDLRRSQITSEIKASPYALADVVEVIDSLANIQSQIANGGAEEGQLAISAFIRYLTADKDRLASMETAVEAHEGMEYTAEEWQYLAGIRQGIIGKLDKKVRRLEAELAALTNKASA